METILEKEEKTSKEGLNHLLTGTSWISLSSLQRPLGSGVRDRFPWCTCRWRKDMPMRAVR